MNRFSRRMTQENHLTRDALIWPLFVREDDDKAEMPKSLPCLNLHSISQLVDQAKYAADLGIPAIAIFPRINPDAKDDDASEAVNGANLVCRATSAVRAEVPELGVINDVALDPFTSSGHDGVIRNGHVDNDETLKILCRQAVVQADAGATIIAPSDMMDGRVGAIRTALDEANHSNVMILSYGAKYASAFYGPFRDAVGAEKTASISGKETYQMNSANAIEAMREIALDIDEGADFIMVKPGLPYLDIIAGASSRFDVPIFAYQVSGEYAMIEAASSMGMLDRKRAIEESLIALRRAGARAILTYFAAEIAETLPK